MNKNKWSTDAIKQAAENVEKVKEIQEVKRYTQKEIDDKLFPLIEMAKWQRNHGARPSSVVVQTLKNFGLEL